MKEIPRQLDFDNGSIFYVDSKNLYHNEDGPSIIYKDGAKYWHIHGNLHREDGPASMPLLTVEEWFIDGKRIEKFCDEHNIPYTYKDWPLEYKILWKLNTHERS